MSDDVELRRKGQMRDSRGRVLALYGKTEVYAGYARQGRYLVWYGWSSSGSFTGHRQTFDSLARAKRVARSYERRGYDTRISDRLLLDADAQ